MDIVDLLLNPGVAIGCVIGIGVATGLHWLFLSEDLVMVQALVIVLFTGLGLFFQLRTEPRNKRDK